MSSPRRRSTNGGAGADGLSLRERYSRRRARKKRRIAAMSRRRRIWRRIGLIATWLLAFFALLMATTVIAFYNLSNVPSPNDIAMPQTAVIYFSDGKTPLARIGTENRTDIPLSQVPESVQWAVLAAEDRGFYTEPGISIRGTLRAFLSDVTGGSTQGGSGITQQYVKNAYLSSAQTLSRKLKELAIAYKLAHQYSKQQILEWYLNTVYFGRGAYGIEAAAQAYYGIHASQLTTAQGALLAALLRSPGYYDPANNLTAAEGRWNYVLSGMVTTGHLTATQQAAMKFPKTKNPQDAPGFGINGPADRSLIVSQVEQELETQDGISSAEINDKGLRITTTINPVAQYDAEQAISQTFSGLTAQQKNAKNALVAVNPQTGAVLAYYGGPGGANDYAGKPDYLDYAGVGCRPPGSSFKPYTLATALSQTLQGKTPVYTIKTVVNGNQTVVVDGTPIHNDPSDAQYAGNVPLDYAMKVSLNTAFDQLAFNIGPSNVATTAHAAGISATCNGSKTLVNADGTTSFGIGIGDYPVHPIDQAVGFSMFADGGVTHPAYFVQSVTDASGHVLFTHTDKGKQVMDSKVANDVTLTLEPVASFSGDGLADGRPSAAKTGTEGIQSGPDNGENSDAWMVGFTPQVSTAVWVGTGDSTHAILPAYGTEEYGRDLPGRTWKAFMDMYLSGQPNMPLPTTQQIYGGPGSTTPATTSAPPTPKHTATASPTGSASRTATSTATATGTPSPTPSNTFTLPTLPGTSPPSTPTTTKGACGGLLQQTCTP